MAQVMQCPHFASDGLSRWCLNGRFPCDCASCNCPDKHFVEITTTTSTTWVDNKTIKED